MKNKSTGVVLGIILVIIGIGYVGNVFEVWNFRIFFPGWWTLFIIIPAVVKIARNGVKPFYLVALGAGLLLLISRLGIIPETLTKLFVPLLILALGFAIIFRGKLGGASIAGEAGSYTAIFSGRTPNYNGKYFCGAYATAVFGGVTLKLEQAEIADKSVIDALAVFGGVDIKLPAEVNVEISCIPLFGGISEPKNRVHNDAYPTVYVNAVCLFGGVDVK